jgi:hypothetical protein
MDQDQKQDRPDGITIPMGANNQAYFGGIAAGTSAGDALAQMSVESTHEARLEYFWLTVGMNLARRLPEDAGDELVGLFVQGAGLRKPINPHALELNLDGRVLAPFEDEQDDEAARQELAALLRRTAQSVLDGYGGDDGNEPHDIVNALNQTVGTFSINLYAPTGTDA